MALEDGDSATLDSAILEWFANAAVDAAPPTTQESVDAWDTEPRWSHREDPRADLDPEAARIFALLHLARDHDGIEPERMRAKAQEMQHVLHAFAPPAPVEYDVDIPGPACSLSARVLAPGRRADGPYPLLLYFHGGGYIAGSPDTHIHVLRRLCLDTESLVVCVRYRLAPEHPYPAAVDDCLATTLWAREHARELGGDPKRLALAGNSAGGNAAAVVALRLHESGAPAPRALALFCPWLDLTCTSESFERLSPGDPLLDRAALEYLVRAYAGDRDVREPDISPVFADLCGLPPTLVVVGELDPLYSEGRQFAERARAAGVPTSFRSFRDMPHDFAMIPGSERGRVALLDSCAYLRGALAPMRDGAASTARLRESVGASSSGR